MTTPEEILSTKFHHFNSDREKALIIEAMTEYARLKWAEACEAQKKQIWDDLKTQVRPPAVGFGDVVSVTRIVRATYEHAPKPEFKP